MSVTQLTATELARYLGAECEYEYLDRSEGHPDFWDTESVNLITAGLIAEAEIGARYRNVRPILKRLSSITPEQAREVMNVAGLNPGGVPVVVSTLSNGIRILSDRRTLDVYSDGQMAAWGLTGHCTFSAIGVVDYLLTHGFDIYNYIDRQLALEHV